MTQTGGMGGIGNMVSGWFPGGQAPGTVVGQETPEWEFPLGQHRVADDVMSNFFRVDAGPTGLNEFLRQNMQSNPAVVSRFRDYVRMGIIRPKNAAAQNLVTAYGGYQAGDQTPLGPMINGMPSGLTESQLNTLANVLQTGADYQIQMLERMGYFNGMPTLEREKVTQELAQGWMGKAIEQFTAMEGQRSAMAQEGLEQQTITNQNIQAMAELFGGQMTTDPATGEQKFTPTEEARQFNTEQSGYLDGQATLTREQQAFNQAKDVAQAASNPRDYIYAQMLGNARGGLAGQAPTNQIQQTTFGPPTTTQQSQFSAPGGQFNQMPNLSTMQGLSPMVQQSLAARPNAQQIGQPPPAGSGQFWQGPAMNLGDQGVWRGATDQANQQWEQARAGMAGANMGSMAPAQQTPPGPGPGQQPWPGAPTGYGQQQQRMAALGGNQQNVAATQNQPLTTSAFTQALMTNRVVPKSGALNNQGSWMTPGQIQGAFNPNKVRTQDYLKGNTSERAGFNAVGSLAGYSDEDLSDIMKSNLPAFSAPGAGKMV